MPRSFTVLSFALLCLAAVLAVCQPALAARYHVRVSGTRLSGDSAPGDWTLANCYDDLGLALANASAEDSLLLYKEIHFLTTAETLTAFVGNQELDAAATECQVIFMPGSQLTINPTVANSILRGVSWVGSVPGSDVPALVLDNSGQQIESVTGEDCLFLALHGSDPVRGGGSCLIGSEPGHGLQLRLERCRFEGNSANSNGGAIHLRDDYIVFMTDCEFIANEVGNGEGGAIAVFSNELPTSLTLTRCNIQENVNHAGPGGGIALENANLTMDDCDVTANLSAADGTVNWAAGAGMFIRMEAAATPSGNRQLIITNSRFVGNRGNLAVDPWAGDGGGILVKGLNLVSHFQILISECLFENNFNAQGGGLYVGRYATGTVRHSRFIGNTAYLNGGATFKGGRFLANQGETVIYEYCEFIQNGAGYDADGQAVASVLGNGGAFMTRRYPRALMYNCSFADNSVSAISSQRRGDAVYNFAEGIPFDNDQQKCSLYNCVFYNSAGVGNDIQVRGDENGFAVVTHCAWESDEFSSLGVTPVATVILIDSPYLAPNDLNLHETSLCIDAGLDVGLTSDIEGVEVPQGEAPDIGAHEFVVVDAITSPFLVAQVSENGIQVACQYPHGDLDLIFRLVAEDLTGRREVPLSEAAPGSFLAVDDRVDMRLGGHVNYILFARHATGDWIEVARTAVALPDPVLLAPQLASYPNPFNPQTTLEYELPRPGRVQLEVYDLRGELVAVLENGFVGAGRHQAVWHGLDRAGKPMPSGVYHALLVTDQGLRSLKLVLVR